MSFEEDPNDEYERFLIYHEESESLFEVFSRNELSVVVDSEPGWENVTGEPEYEDKFKEEEAENEQENQRQNAGRSGIQLESDMDADPAAPKRLH